MERAKTDSLLSLNDDCINGILKLVSQDVLIQLAGTCSRLQELCELKFVQTELVVADYVGKVDIRSKKYLRYMCNVIKELKLNLHGQSSNIEWDCSPLVRFIETKCHPKLRRIVITGKLNLVPFCSKIEEFLHYVDEVVLDGHREKGEVEFLKCCPNMTKLTLRHRNTIHCNYDVDAILLEKFENLRHFHYQHGNMSYMSTKNLEIFFQTNNRIDSLELFFSLCNEEHYLKYIYLIDHLLHLKHLVIKFDNSVDHYSDDIYSYLERLCERSNIESLEIGGGTDFKFFRLRELKQLSKICLKNCILENAVRSLNQMVHLRTLVLENVKLLNTETWTSEYEYLPQIEEVEIEFSEHRTDDEIVAVLVRKWKNLKRILIRCCGCRPRTKFNIVELNDQRKLLRGASALTIYTNDKRNETNLEPELVKLQFKQFETDCPRDLLPLSTL